jgi:hypothetical protein
MKWREVNWWKPAFIVTLIAFEITREIAVLNAEGLQVAIGVENIYRDQGGGYIRADGLWQRTDGGDRLVAMPTTILCDRTLELECTVASSMVSSGYVHIPRLDRLDATFTETGVEWLEDSPLCYTNFVRIDAVKNLVTATRKSKRSKDPLCKGTEDLIQSKLGGYDLAAEEAKRDEHFLPVLRMVATIFD